MATRSTISASPLNRLGNRVSQGWRMLFGAGDLLALLIAGVLLLMPVLALNAAGWPLRLGTLAPAAILSVIFGFALARSQYNELFALILSSLYGVGFVLLIAAINEPGDLAAGALSVFQHTSQWITDAFSSGINQDELVTTLLLSLLFWFLGYNIAWHLFRVDRIWRVIVPPGLILVTNSLYYSGEANLDLYLIVFVFLSLLLIVRSNLDARAWDWYVSGIPVPRNLRRQFFRVGVILSLLVLLIAGVIPSADLQDRLDEFQKFMQSEPLRRLSEFWNRIFTSGDMSGPTTADYYGGDNLQLGGAIRLGEQIVFLVEAPPGRRYYWRSRTFDIYSDGRWSPRATVRLTVEQPSFQVSYQAEDLGSRVPVQQRFTLGLSASRLVYTAPQPLSIDLPSRVDLRYVPDDTLRQGMNISVIRPLHIIKRGEAYTVTSLLSTADAAELRAAPASYPDWLSQIYLQIPPSISERTFQLARQIVEQAGATNPYDQAKAVETWLRTNILYNEAIPLPPSDRDPVEWVLFEYRQGYCNYYASAMIMMLRALGIPARMAAGFAEGSFEDSQGAYMVRERDAHTWVEVYFPGYGWVEFEPTAAQAPLIRTNDIPLPVQPTSTLSTSPTPTFTPSPTATPTGDPLTPQPQVAPILPSMTPTLTPTPTPTPVIVPTRPPELQPQQRDSLLSLVLRTLGLALLVLLIVVLIIGSLVFVYWWWEWRGMGGLSPITRAYARLERYLGLIGIHFTRQQTPDERRQDVARALPRVEPPVTAITRMYTAERYGPGRPPEEMTVQDDLANSAWTETRSGILSRYLRRLTRWSR